MIPTAAILWAVSAAVARPTNAQDSRPPNASSRASAGAESGPLERPTSRATDLRGEAAKLFRDRRFDELLEMLKPALTETSDAADLWVMAAEASMALEDFGAAAARFEQAIKLRADLSPLCVNLGLAYVRLDRIEEGRDFLKPFVENPRPDRAAKACLGLGIASAALGETKEAGAWFTRAVRLQPDDARPRYRLGSLDFEAGRHADAVERFREALVRDRLHHGAAHGLARALRAAGRIAEADAASKRHTKLIEVADGIRRTLRELPRSAAPAKTCFDLASLFVIAGDKKAAEMWLARSLAIDPGFVPAAALKPHLAAMEEPTP